MLFKNFILCYNKNKEVFMIKLLDEILLSDNVVEDFYLNYKNNKKSSCFIDQNIPDIRKCEGQQQDNPWHKYNVLEHILHSVEEMNKLTRSLSIEQRRMLAYVMLFHDIGKPDKHIKRVKDGRMIDSFYDHNVRSAEIARQCLPKLNFEASEIAVMEKLIFKHDIFVNIKLFKTKNAFWRTLNEQLLEEIIVDLDNVGNGEELLSYLIMIGRADSGAQNELMTKESFQLLDKFEQMLNQFKIKNTLTM